MLSQISGNLLLKLLHTEKYSLYILMNSGNAEYRISEFRASTLFEQPEARIAIATPTLKIENQDINIRICV